MSVLVIIVAFYVLGIGLGLHFPVSLFPAIAAPIMGLATLATAVVTRHKIALASVCVALVSGWARPSLPDLGIDLQRRGQPCTRLVQGRVTESSLSRDGKSRFPLHLELLSNCLSGPGVGGMAELSGKIYVGIGQAGSAVVRPGDRIRFRAALRPLRSPRNPGRTRKLQGEIHYSAFLTDGDHIAKVEHHTLHPARHVDRLRQYLSSFWQNNLDPLEANLARALTLGESGALVYSQRERFRRTGTAHLLSVSGLHLGLTVLLFFGIARRLLLRLTSLAERLDVGRIAAALAIPLTIAFVFLTGSRAPVVRAAVMVISALMARILNRSKGTIEALALAGAAILMADPNSLKQPGFQLSFTAVLAFVAVLRPGDSKDIEETVPRESPSAWRGIVTQARGAVGNLLRCTLAASASTAPLTLFHFGYVSWIAVVANTFAVPVVSFVILPILLTITALATVSAPFAGIFTVIPGALLRLLDSSLHAISRIPSTIENPGPFLAAAIVCAAVAVLLFVAHKTRAALSMMLVAFIGAMVARLVDPSPFPPGKLTLDFLDVGQGDATLITFPNGQHWLVDAGGRWGKRYDVGQRVIVPVLRSLGVDEIDTVVLTHPDLDHVGGMDAVVNAFDVTTLYDNGQGAAEGADPAYHQMLDTAKEREIIIVKPPGICAPKTIAGVGLQVLHPCFEHGSYDPDLSSNNNSIVLSISYGFARMILPGDIEAETEKYLVGNQALGPADLLKLPHHGSRSSSSIHLLDAVTPWLGIVSAGGNSRFSFPHREVLTRCRVRGIHLRRTDIHGAIRVTTDGRRISVLPKVPFHSPKTDRQCKLHI